MAADRLIWYHHAGEGRIHPGFRRSDGEPVNTDRQEEAMKMAEEKERIF